MKLSVMTYSLVRANGVAVEDCPAAVAACGAKGINWVGTYGREPAELRRLSRDAGVEVSCYTFALETLIRGNGDWRDEAKRNFAAAAALGAPVAMVVPMPIFGMTDPAATRRRWIDILCELLPMARTAGCLLTIESFANASSPFVTGAELLEAAAALPELRFTFDPGNAATGENPLTTLSAISGRIAYAHFKDWRRVPAPEPGSFACFDGSSFVPAVPGCGDMPLADWVEALAATGYDGFTDIEYEGAEPPAREAVNRAAKFLLSLPAFR